MPAPASWEIATPVFGIRYPRPTAPAKNLPAAFEHIGVDLESALLSGGTAPPGLVYKTGTAAERAAATPTKDQVWIETDTGNMYIGTGSAWVLIGPAGGGSIQTYTPVWSAVGSGAAQPTIGNGSITGRYLRISGSLYWIQISFATGSTTNGGNGAYRLSLPSGRTGVAREQVLGTVKGYFAGRDNFMGTAIVEASQTVIRLLMPRSSSDVRLADMQNAAIGGDSSSGIPLVSGFYPLQNPSNFGFTGMVELN